MSKATLKHSLKCEWIGRFHCGREITQTTEIGASAQAHIDFGDRHEWRSMHQCVSCREEEQRVKAGCSEEQRSWWTRRLALDLSQRELAGTVGISLLDLCRYERCHTVAPARVRIAMRRALAAAEAGRG